MTDQALSADPTTPPPLANVLRNPGGFYRALQTTPAQPLRYVGLVLLTGLLSGLAAAVTARSTVQAQTALHLPGLSGPMTYGMLVFSGVFLMVVAWLLLWFLGNLGAGAKGRAAEVYGATFVVQLVWSVVLLVVGFVAQPDITVPAPHLQGLDSQHAALAVQKYSQAVAAQVSNTPLLRVSNYLSYAMYLWQVFMAYTGFQALTGDNRKAMLGIAYPVGIFAVLGLIFWLLNQAVGNMLAK